MLDNDIAETMKVYNKVLSINFRFSIKKKKLINFERLPFHQLTFDLRKRRQDLRLPKESSIQYVIKTSFIKSRYNNKYDILCFNKLRKHWLY